LRQIIDKCLARQKPVLLSLIDLMKLFDCVYRESLCKIVANYGIPNKLINIMKRFYQRSCCAVRTEGVLGELFELHSGVKHGFILSPLLFRIIMDWILKRSMEKS